MKGHDGTSPVHSQPIDDRTCRACHDEANSPQYDPVAYAARISCARMRDNPDDPANVTPKPERRPSPP
jgi:hypothetical protein